MHMHIKVYGIAYYELGLNFSPGSNVYINYWLHATNKLGKFQEVLFF